MNVHVLQHVPFEGPGAIAAWAAGRHIPLTVCHCYGGVPLPSPAADDLVVVMGGPMSVHDERQFPWLVDEKRFIERVLSAGGRVLGVCLGAQLIADVLGARVFPNRCREIGWFPVGRVAGAERTTFGTALPASALAFHWHGETFDRPAGAMHLLRSAGCENQAFAIGSRCLALQFHFEMTEAGARALVEHCPDDLAPGTYVQTATQILGPPGQFADANRTMAALLDALGSEHRA